MPSPPLMDKVIFRCWLDMITYRRPLKTVPVPKRRLSVVILTIPNVVQHRITEGLCHVSRMHTPAIKGEFVAICASSKRNTRKWQGLSRWSVVFAGAQN